MIGQNTVMRYKPKDAADPVVQEAMFEYRNEPRDGGARPKRGWGIYEEGGQDLRLAVQPSATPLFLQS
jgi:hypothetical protein